MHKAAARHFYGLGRSALEGFPETFVACALRGDDNGGVELVFEAIFPVPLQKMRKWPHCGIVWSDGLSGW